MELARLPGVVLPRDIIRECPIKVNGTPLDDALIREEANLMRPHLFQSMQGADPREVEIRLREWAVENAIEKALLRQAALADPEPVPPEQLEEALRRIATASSALADSQRSESSCAFA